MTKRTIWAVSIVAGVIVMGVLVWLSYAAVTRDTRQDIPLEEIGGDSSGAFRGWHDNSDHLCDDVPGCVQGYSSDHVNMLRFASIANSNAFVDEADDAYQSNWIVIEYTDSALTQDERQELQLYLDGLAASDG